MTTTRTHITVATNDLRNALTATRGHAPPPNDGDWPIRLP